MQEIFQQHPWLLLILALWTLPWKGVALWKASRFGQKVWFVAILVTNTIGLLEIIYIFLVARKKHLELSKDYQKKPMEVKTK